MNAVKTCATCLHSTPAANGVTLCNQRPDVVSGQAIHFAATWRLKGLPESLAEEAATALDICGPQARFHVQAAVEVKASRWSRFWSFGTVTS